MRLSAAAPPVSSADVRSPAVRRHIGPVPLTWLATIGWVLAVAAVATAILLLARTDPAYRGNLDAFFYTFLLIATAFPLVGAAIARRRPDHYAGWAFLAAGLMFSLVLAGVAYGYAGLPPNPARLPGAHVVFWLGSTFFLGSIATIGTLFFFYFPDGRLLGKRWRLAVGLTLFSIATYTLVNAVRPDDISEDFPGLRSPIPATDELAPALGLLMDLGNLGLLVSLILAGLSLVLRYRRSGQAERRQIKWIAWLGTGVAVAFTVAVFQTGPVSEAALLLGFILIASLPIVVAIAILRHRLYDIDHLINRTVVYGGLTAILAGTYAASIKLFQAIFVALTGDESDAAIVLTTLVLATTLTPIKGRLEKVAGRTIGTGASHQPALHPTVALSLDDPLFRERLDQLAQDAIRRAAASAPPSSERESG